MLLACQPMLTPWPTLRAGHAGGARGQRAALGDDAGSERSGRVGELPVNASRHVLRGLGATASCARRR